MDSNAVHGVVKIKAEEGNGKADMASVDVENDQGKSSAAIPPEFDEKKSTQVEVLALRTQVAYLQDTIEDLRKQLDCVLAVLDDSKTKKTSGSKSKEKKGKGAKSTPGKAKIGLKRPRSFGILPVDGSEDSNSALSGGANDLKLTPTELLQVCESLEKQEPLAAKQKEMAIPQSVTEPEMEVIKSISKATQLDQNSVCKIIKYFSELSTKEDRSKIDMEVFGKLEVTLQAQKVGAN